MKENYDQLMLQIMEQQKNTGKKPVLLLQCCCAPCSSAVLERLREHFTLKLYYYNPNIFPRDEYLLRLSQFEKLLSGTISDDPIELLEGPYEPEMFEQAVKGLETEPEGGARCRVCFRMRLEKTAQKAKEIGADYFCTTLTVSPHKDSQVINALGREIGQRIGVPFLPSDFKKREGYKRSTELSSEFGLYRQNYCGCRYSMWFLEQAK